MQGIKIILLFIALMLTGSNMIYAHEDTALNSALEKMTQSVVTNNPQEYIRHTSPRLIIVMGGEENALKLFKESLSTLRDVHNITIDTVINYNKLDVIKLETISFKFIPQIMVTSVADTEESILIVTNVLAIKENVSPEWKFIDTNFVGDEEIDIMIPEFKDKVKIPRLAEEPLILPKKEVQKVLQNMLNFLDESLKQKPAVIDYP
ncbi:hypothetical protein [Sphingobacterium anhuiense]|uniref:Uncharacterized protein n=1 Tax=Sphingobacterium anhuiense TaxID=493780 RepID=A0ABW5YQB2_9SPHI